MRDADDSGSAAARAVGLELSVERYVRTLDRLRRCGRACRVAGLSGPLARAVPGTDRRTVTIASADAREALGKLWTAGERYRRVVEAVGGDPESVDPGAGRSAAAFATLRGRLTVTPDRAVAGEYTAAASTLREARSAVQTLLEARRADCETLAALGVGTDRLREAATEAAAEMNEAYEVRRATERAERESGESGREFITPVGNSDAIDPAALKDENVDPAALMEMVEDDEVPDPDPDPEGLSRAVEGDSDAGPEPDADGEGASADEGPPPEEAIGSSFDITVDDEAEPSDDGVD